MPSARACKVFVAFLATALTITMKSHSAESRINALYLPYRSLVSQPIYKYTRAMLDYRLEKATAKYLANAAKGEASGAKPVAGDGEQQLYALRIPAEPVDIPGPESAALSRQLCDDLGALESLSPESGAEKGRLLTAVYKVRAEEDERYWRDQFHLLEPETKAAVQAMLDELPDLSEETVIDYESLGRDHPNALLERLPEFCEHVLSWITSD